MPAELQTVLGQELSKGNIIIGHNFKDFLINYSESSSATRHAPPAPIAAIHVANGGDNDEDYAYEQW